MYSDVITRCHGHISLLPAPLSPPVLTAVQRQTTVAAYSKSKQLLLFVFALQDIILCNPALSQC